MKSPGKRSSFSVDSYDDLYLESITAPRCILNMAQGDFPPDEHDETTAPACKPGYVRDFGMKHSTSVQTLQGHQGNIQIKASFYSFIHAILLLYSDLSIQTITAPDTLQNVQMLW